MEPDYQKIFGRAIIACWAVIISCWIISLFIPEIFLIAVNNKNVILIGNYIEQNTWALYVFAVFSSSLSMFPYWLACTGKRWFDNKRDFWICAITILISVGIKIIFPFMGFVIDLFLCMLLIPIFMGAKICNCLIYIFATTIYQVITISTRGTFVFAFLCEGPINLFILTIDTYVFYWLMYIKALSRKEGSYGLGRHAIFREIRKGFAGHARKISCSWQNKRSRRNRQTFSRTKAKIKAILFLRKTRSYAIVFGCIGATAYLTSHYLEAIILFLAYLSLRWTFPETFHAYSPRNCTIISSIVFSFLVTTSVPIRISLVSGVILALILSCQLYREWHHRNLMEEAVVKDMKLHEFEEHFNPEEQAIKKLRDAGFNEVHQQITVLYSIQGMTMKEVSEKLGYGEQVCKNYFGHVTKIFPEYKKGYKKP